MVHLSYGSRIKREPQRSKGGSDHSFSHDHVLSRFPYLSLSDISSLLMVFKSLGCPVKDRGLFLFFKTPKSICGNTSAFRGDRMEVSMVRWCPGLHHHRWTLGRYANNRAGCSWHCAAFGIYPTTGGGLEIIPLPSIPLKC